MKEPPPDDEKGVASAGTPTTPDRASSLAGNQNSQRTYVLHRPGVKPRAVDADASVSEHGAAAVDDLSAAERVFLEICKAQTGRELPEDIKERQNEARALLLAQSYRIADALESQGIRAYGPSKLSLVGVLSGEVVELPDFRNIVFIPSVAQRKRHKMLKHLEFFMQEHPFSRMWVFTSGDRVPLEGVRERITWLHRRLSKLNAQPFFQALGVKIVFRSTELGEVRRDESDKATFHIHAHVIVHLEKKLSKERWSELLRNVRDWWKHHFSDAKCIQQAREACKYVVKPGDLDQLTDAELAELHHELFRLHLVQCLGSFKDQRKDIEDTKRRLVRVPAPVSSRWELVADWNRGRPAKDFVETPKTYESAPDDWLLCTLPPSFALSAKAEPLAVVLNYTGQWIAKNRRIIALREVCGSNFGKDSSQGKEEKSLLPRRSDITALESGGAAGQVE